MSREISFVVTYDTEAKEFFVDMETQSVKFQDGDVWDTKSGQWIAVDFEDEDDMDTIMWNLCHDKLVETVEGMKLEVK
jgi:hypothetical protein